MKLLVFDLRVYMILLLLITISCRGQKPALQPQTPSTRDQTMKRIFPNAFLERGKDDDHSYMSMKTTRQSDGSLKIDVTGWGIVQYGLSLAVETSDVLKLYIMGECGTVTSKTWEKVSFSHVVEKEAEAKLRQIEYDRGSSEEEENRNQLILQKRPR